MVKLGGYYTNITIKLGNENNVTLPSSYLLFSRSMIFLSISKWFEGNCALFHQIASSVLL